MAPPINHAVLTPLGASRCELGEGPTWHAGSQTLLFVDILGGTMYRLSPESGHHQVTHVAEELSAVLPTVAGGIVAAAGHQLLELDGAGSLIRSWTVEGDLTDNRFNDCRVDPTGRLWAGTMSKLRAPGEAGLYRLADNGGLELAIPHTTLSNGLAWSPDGTTMYFIDSTTQQVDAIDVEPATGELGNRRTLIAIEPSDGLPDGMTVDAGGGIWVCLFGGGAVKRYLPSGALDFSIDLPVQHPTCPVFGGPDLSTLFITSSRHFLDEGQRAASPWAGALLAIRPGFSGVASAEAILPGQLGDRGLNEDHSAPTPSRPQ